MENCAIHVQQNSTKGLKLATKVRTTKTVWGFPEPFFYFEGLIGE